ncbi:hypothetical protein FB45DRAFT_362149 [Roridomyces roridus]|uniref:Uncharacterized protein n=1 Tax=Roridomyces roridus TaxID=1738132 RepID=A0AAD7FTF7_9AGAR|nr:hypothetical protein FB45DRAFT_362149 [Roridomyces roridus]
MLIPRVAHLLLVVASQIALSAGSISISTTRSFQFSADAAQCSTQCAAPIDTLKNDAFSALCTNTFLAQLKTCLDCDIQAGVDSVLDYQVLVDNHIATCFARGFVIANLTVLDATERYQVFLPELVSR